MRSFEDLVGKALDKAEGRTLASTDKIRVAISEVVESATQRFADATEDMRRTAGSIRPTWRPRAPSSRRAFSTCRRKPSNRPRRSAAP